MLTIKRRLCVPFTPTDLSHSIQTGEVPQDLGIVHSSFNLNDTSNLTNRKPVIAALSPSLDRMLQVSLDKYGFFAVTRSLTTLQEIIALVEEQNCVWQEKFDGGRPYIRDFDVSLPLVRQMHNY